MGVDLILGGEGKIIDAPSAADEDLIGPCRPMPAAFVQHPEGIRPLLGVIVAAEFAHVEGDAEVLCLHVIEAVGEARHVLLKAFEARAVRVVVEGIHAVLPAVFGGGGEILSAPARFEDDDMNKIIELSAKH